MTKRQLTEWIKRSLGYPSVKVELENDHLEDAIGHARQMWLKWAEGNSTQETFFTQLLSAGQYLYDMPASTLEVIDVVDSETTGGVNTLFTIENALYNAGLFNPWYGSGYNLISFHTVLDFGEMINRYTTSNYNWKYHRYTNQIEIQPPPTSGNSLTLTDGSSIDSPGYIMVRARMIHSSTTDLTTEEINQSIYGETWVKEYSLALSKISLGYIRRKFSNFASLGNQGISLDGDSLVQEGKEEKERLEERLKNEEVYEGYGIIVG